MEVAMLKIGSEVGQVVVVDRLGLGDSILEDGERLGYHEGCGADVLLTKVGERIIVSCSGSLTNRCRFSVKRPRRGADVSTVAKLKRELE